MSEPIDKTRRLIVKFGSIIFLSAVISPFIKADELTSLVNEESSSASTLAKGDSDDILTNIAAKVSASSVNNNLIAVRIWPSSVYTRLTLEADNTIEAKSMIQDNKTVVINIINMRLNQVLQKIQSKVLAEDPIIKNIGIAQYSPNIIRIKIYLKQKINFKNQAIPPVELGSVNYRYRYVLDMYPLQSKDNTGVNDDLLALLQLNGATVDNSNSTNSDYSNDINNVDDADDISKIIRLTHKMPSSTSSSNTSLKQIIYRTDYNNANEVKNANNMNKVSRKLVDKTSNKILVMIDPGHGGEDPGAIGPTGIKEKDVVLDIGKKLYDIIKQTDYMTAQLTRSEDIFIPLGTRVAIARRIKADVFISIHADAFTTPSAKGASVFVLSDKGASSSFAKWLAQTQNNADLIGGMLYKNQDRVTNGVLLDMTQTWTLKKSTRLGQMLMGNLAQIVRLHNGNVEKAAFAVLKAPDIPSVLVETAFISNATEEAMLNNPEFRQKMAQTIFNGLNKFSLESV